MLLRGERINPINIEQIVDNIFGNSEHAKRKQSLANAALGIIRSASLIVHRIGLGLAKAKNLFGKHAIKQVDRLLSNDKLNVSDSFAQTVPYIIGGRKEIVSSSKPRVDTSRLPNTSSSLPSSSSSSSSVQLSKETHRLLGVTDRRYKSQLFERPGKTKDQTSLNAAKIELQGKQIDLAIERGIKFDHVSKVEASQDGLLRHIKNINARLSHPELPTVERKALETELSNASKLLDYTEQFVPRSSTQQSPPPPKPRAT